MENIIKKKRRAFEKDMKELGFDCTPKMGKNQELLLDKGEGGVL